MTSLGNWLENDNRKSYFILTHIFLCSLGQIGVSVCGCVGGFLSEGHVLWLRSIPNISKWKETEMGKGACLLFTGLGTDGAF